VANGSLLIIDRSKDPSPNTLVLIRHEGQFYCRLMVINNGKTEFTNGTTAITPTDDTEIIGVITNAIKTFGAAEI
jgi:SOS-response transcriptional repressor LexA